MMKIFGFLLILLSPLCMGLPWVRLGGAKSAITRVCFAFVAGYFMRLTLFHAVALPMTILDMRFSTMANVFTVLLVVACMLSVWMGRDAIRLSREKLKLTPFEIIYCATFIGLLLFQLYMTIFMDPTIMTYDDASYTVYSSDALATDYMFITDPKTGMFAQLGFRAIQSSLLFPAYITRMTGMPVPVVERTFSYALNLLLAYGCYFYMAEDLYKHRENQFIFLILLSVIYIFGYHSHYSMTFRLLGPNSQGKAILAVTLVPFMFVLMRKWLDRPYDWKRGAFLFLLSDSACALSLMGAGYVLAIVVLLTLLSLFRKERRWKHLLYPAWAGAMPCIYLVAYILLYNLV